MRKVISALAVAVALALPGVPVAAEPYDAELAFENGDYARAITLYRASAEAGDEYAQVLLGFMYWYGEEYYGSAVQADVNTSLAWFARAANQGSAVATSMLTLLFQEGGAATLAATDVVYSGDRADAAAVTAVEVLAADAVWFPDDGHPAIATASSAAIQQVSAVRD